MGNYEISIVFNICEFNWMMYEFLEGTFEIFDQPTQNHYS